MKIVSQLKMKEIIRGMKPGYAIVVNEGYNQYRVKTYTYSYMSKSDRNNGKTHGVNAVERILNDYCDNKIIGYEKGMSGKIHSIKPQNLLW